MLIVNAEEHVGRSRGRGVAGAQSPGAGGR
jgi:hypothetical protein